MGERRRLTPGKRHATRAASSSSLCSSSARARRDGERDDFGPFFGGHDRRARATRPPNPSARRARFGTATLQGAAHSLDSKLAGTRGGAAPPALAGGGGPPPPPPPPPPAALCGSCCDRNHRQQDGPQPQSPEDTTGRAIEPNVGAGGQHASRIRREREGVGPQGLEALQSVGIEAVASARAARLAHDPPRFFEHLEMRRDRALCQRQHVHDLAADALAPTLQKAHYRHARRVPQRRCEARELRVSVTQGWFDIRRGTAEKLIHV